MPKPRQTWVHLPRHCGSWEAADEAVLITMHRKKNKIISLFKSLVAARRAQRTNQGRIPLHLYSISPHLPQFQQSAGATPIWSLWSYVYVLNLTMLHLPPPRFTQAGDWTPGLLEICVYCRSINLSRVSMTQATSLSSISVTPVGGWKATEVLKISKLAATLEKTDLWISSKQRRPCPASFSHHQDCGEWALCYHEQPEQQLIARVSISIVLPRATWTTNNSESEHCVSTSNLKN
jgi:hypothetical protein